DHRDLPAFHTRRSSDLRPLYQRPRSRGGRRRHRELPRPATRHRHDPEGRAMTAVKLGMFTMPLHHPGKNYAQLLEEARAAVTLADRLGCTEPNSGADVSSS